MRAYKVEIEINLDDEGYLSECNWIEQAISEQLNQDDKERIVYCIVTPITETTSERVE